ncbi:MULTISPECIES: hypothetical protein [Photorhabdus]|uniref:Cyanophage baseplate Pam3 plug gp18 domain-containing protein n=2 Tax=Photorhabdus TaxID=29487 RepID=A0A7X5QHT3_9GAMM|nr:MULTISPECIES: hypothetical protein [Photorhabdus]KER03406.1 hypothetical protein MEG1DRAFT_01881 [Photorhabdus temperata subsp. temperata Meg1]NHB94410.1 hypothetical protein [Photorhabdus cinerea]
MIVEIALSPIPNQTTSFSISGDLIDVTLESRLGKIFATVQKNEEYLVCNRICRNLSYLCRWLIFVDIEGNSDPEYSGLGSRYKLVWNDEI